jgi:hypothetical protein
VEKVNPKEIDLFPTMTHNLSLTTQNFVVAFHINREVPEGRGPEERKIVSIYLFSKED